jgi:porin
VFALPGLPQPAQAEGETAAPKKAPMEQVQEVWARDLVTGDWEGWRTALQEHGIDPHFRLAQYGQWVADGGVETDGGYGGTMDYRLNLDLNKLFGMWEGLSVNMHARSRWGQDINSAAGAFALPNAGLLMPLPGRYTGTDVTGLTVSQYLPFFAGRLANVTLGKLDVIDTVNGFFPDIVGFGQEGFWNINALVTALPWFGAVNGLGLYGGMFATINQEYGMVESGFLFTGTENNSASWNSVQDSFDDGVWMAGWHRFLWKLEDKPGYFLVFAAGSTREQPSNDPRDVILIPGVGLVDTDEEKPWDIAMYAYQVFWQAENDPNRKATIFIGGTVGPDNPQFAQYHVFAAIEAHGPMGSRPQDRMGVSFWKNWLSDDYKQLVRPVANLRDLYGFELYYNIAINKWLHVTPDLQFIKNEVKGNDLAIVPGIRAVIDF